MLNVLTTEDPDAAAATLRETWGGAVCVASTRYTEAELLQVQEELTDVDGFISSGVNTPANTVDLEVWLGTTALQEQLDDEHGEGAVTVYGLLQPER